MLVSVLSFAISLSVIKWPGIPGSVIAWWRLVGSSILWWLFVLIRHRRTGRPLPDRDAWRLATPAALFFGVNITFVFLGITRTSVVHADFLGSMAPLLLIPAGFFFFHEQPRWRALRWGALSAIGLVLILTNGPDGGAATVTGDLLVVLGILGLAAYQLLSKRARGRGVDPFDFMAIVMTVALVTATPVVLVSAADELWPLGWKAWTAVGLLSVMTGMVAHGLLYYAHRSVPIATISILQISQPAQSTLWAWVLLGEAITIVQVPGMALVTIGMALVVWFSQRPAPAVAAATRPSTGRPGR